MCVHARVSDLNRGVLEKRKMHVCLFMCEKRTTYVCVCDSYLISAVGSLRRASAESSVKVMDLTNARNKGTCVCVYVCMYICVYTLSVCECMYRCEGDGFGARSKDRRVEPERHEQEETAHLL
jgi:hypothetical protein